MNQFFTIVCPVTLVALLLPWMFLVTIRYIKIDVLFRAAICFAISGVYMFLINSVLAAIIDHKPFALQKYNFNVWTGKYVNGNIIIIITMMFLVMAVVLSMAGISLLMKRKEKVL
ncbi:hypothetical protein [Clostridium autoethanogenum]|uniref:hypothetical protein n=1 Tax=Clostridium autoethanogenum TaxID=84023 RepID=UPI00160557C2|nr:hypothetical protein [Clostridium autoethanogenum]